MQPDSVSTCRTCLSNDAEVDLFSEEKLYEMLTACVRFHIQADSKLPTKICISCRRKLEDAYDFIKKCEDSQEFLENLSNHVKLKDECKVEIDDPIDDINESFDQKDHDDFFLLKTDDVIEVKNDELLECLTKIPNLVIRKNKTKISEKTKQCNLCNKVYYSKSGYYRHMRTSHKGMKKETKFGKSVSRKLRRNKEETILEKSVPKQKSSQNICRSCGKVFVDDVTGFKEHVVSKVCRDLRIFKCEKCGKENTGMRRHEIHLSTHNFENVPCEYCGKSFQKLNSLRKHLRAVHERDPDCVCKICKRSFPNKVKLSGHMRVIHLPDDKMKKCDICGFTSKFKHSMEGHMRSHLNIRPFNCRYCDKSFTVRKTRTDHENLHKGVTPYKCPVCFVGFTQKGNMKSHFKYNHKEMKYFEWPKEDAERKTTMSKKTFSEKIT